jgi:hypothetical protein
MKRTITAVVQERMLVRKRITVEYDPDAVADRRLDTAEQALRKVFCQGLVRAVADAGYDLVDSNGLEYYKNDHDADMGDPTFDPDEPEPDDTWRFRYTTSKDENDSVGRNTADADTLEDAIHYAKNALAADADAKYACVERFNGEESVVVAEVYCDPEGDYKVVKDYLAE